MSQEQQSPPAPAATRDDEQQLDQMARHVLEEISTVGTGADVQLDEYIHILAEYRTLCESREQYKEAELVQHVLKHLRLEEETRHVKGLTEQQDLERQGLEEAHMLEFKNFNAMWNEKIDAFEEEEVDKKAELIERHAKELSDFHKEMTEQEHRHVKYSKDLINLRTIQKTLATQRNYADAQKVKVKGDKIEELESEKIAREKAEIYAKKEAKIVQRHQQELAALQKRLERKKMEFERTRKKELEVLIQRYNNVRRGLEAQQNIIRSKTGNLLLKHANNKKTDNSGSQAIITSMTSGTFGPAIKRRKYQNEGEEGEEQHVE